MQRPAGGFVIVGGQAIASGPCPAVELERSFDYFSYELSARYELNDYIAVYARHGLGQKAGGINIPVASIDSPIIFAPEEVRDYEIGLKADDLLGGTLGFNVAVFYSDYTNLQRNIGTLIPGTAITATATVNAGAATVQGIEFDFRWRPVDGLTISGFAGYTDAEYDEFITLNANVADRPQRPALLRHAQVHQPDRRRLRDAVRRRDAARRRRLEPPEQHVLPGDLLRGRRAASSTWSTRASRGPAPTINGRSRPGARTCSTTSISPRRRPTAPASRPPPRRSSPPTARRATRCSSAPA